MSIPNRTPLQKFKDILTAPIRALLIHEENKWGLTSLQSERFEYVRREIKGHCLDIGCGRHNRFIHNYLDNKGIGVDIFRYDGLTQDQILQDPTHLPFSEETFNSVTFIANINHVPEPLRDKELLEAFRVLKPGGNIIITMGNPIVEVFQHIIVLPIVDGLLGTKFDVDRERGMLPGENYYLSDREIRKRLISAGFTNLKKKYFYTQYALNHLITGIKWG